MRLLHVSTFRLESFIDEECPPYAILSHTWGDQEITLQELQSKDMILWLQSAKTLISDRAFYIKQKYGPGCLKIAGCALQAETDGFEYIWCDTCCIDKTNSTELSEAINSMYLWYRDQLCYAYLADVPSADREAPGQRRSDLVESRWFTRGWTLQELIAPASVVFFDARWHPIGTRSDNRGLIATRTGIDNHVLDGGDPLKCSVASRMSWAAQRQTTRLEDLAYCLMGLFGVNMPLIYGEKTKAFLRLQTEIMRISEDHSLFAWRRPEGSSATCGLLASQPGCFNESRSIAPLLQYDDEDSAPPFSMTSRGVNIALPLSEVNTPRQYSVPNHCRLFFARLDCYDTNDGRGPLGLYLIRESGGGGPFRRYLPDRIDPASQIVATLARSRTTIYVAQNDNNAQKARSQWTFSFSVPHLPPCFSEQGVILKLVTNDAMPHVSWNPEERQVNYSELSAGLGAVLYLGRKDGSGKMLLIGLDSKLHARYIFRSGANSVNAVWREDVGVQLESFVARQYSIQWHAICLRDDKAPSSETTLDLGSWEQVERARPKFYQRKCTKVWKERKLKIRLLVAERWLGGQRIHDFRFQLEEISMGMDGLHSSRDPRRLIDA